MGFDLQFLDHEVLVTILPRAFGKPVDRNRNDLVNDQVPGLLAFGRTGSLASPPLLVGRIGVRCVERARADGRPRRQLFQARYLRTQLINHQLLLGNHPQQVLHEGRPLLRRHLDTRNLDRLGSIHALQQTPKPPSR